MAYENSMSTTLFYIFFALLVFFYYIFSANPYGIVKHFRISVMILSLFTVFGFLIFIEYYTNNKIFKGDSAKTAGTNFIKYLYKYLYYLLYLLGIALIGYFLYKIVVKVFLLSFQSSFWVSVGLLILVLALFSQMTKDMKFDSPTYELLKTLVMYIPCLITDFIEYVKQDYANTPSTVFIVFCMILVYVSIFYLYPLFVKMQYNNDGILLIDKPAYLKDDILSMTSNELKEKILEKRPFYDKWFKKWMVDEPTKTTTSTVDLEGKKEGDSIRLLVPPDSITYPYYVKENFTSVSDQDLYLIPFEEIKRRIQDIYGNLFDFSSEKDPDYAKKIMNEFIKEHPEILTFMEKVNYLYHTAYDTITQSPRLLFSDKKRIPQNIYHYALSSWVYLQSIDSKELQMIYSFGSRPSLYYDPVQSTLCVYINYGASNQKLLYKSDKILYQRWNLIVMNYNYGTLDLFINNHLVGTYPKVVTYIEPSDMLIVGSRQNQNIGGICNMKYYELPIGSEKINSIYTSFHNKKIPI